MNYYVICGSFNSVNLANFYFISVLSEIDQILFQIHNANRLKFKRITKLNSLIVGKNSLAGWNMTSYLQPEPNYNITQSSI